MRRLFFPLALALALGLSACETATPYQPLAQGSKVSGGFSDQKLEANRFRVTFAGNTLTGRQTVEDYLLYRAAELTIAQGYDWFTAVDRHTSTDKHTYVEPIGPYGGWRPYWRWYGGYGSRHWRGWDPWWGDPFWADSVDVQQVEKFEASAEILLGKGPKPEGDPKAFDARAVMTNLGPKIVRPKS
jgi:hypothetical protein